MLLHGKSHETAMNRFRNHPFTAGTMLIVSIWPYGLREDAKLQNGSPEALVGRCAS